MVIFNVWTGWRVAAVPILPGISKLLLVSYCSPFDGSKLFQIGGCISLHTLCTLYCCIFDNMTSGVAFPGIPLCSKYMTSYKLIYISGVNAADSAERSVRTVAWR